MNELEFSFAKAPWELALEKLRRGDSLSAARLLALTDGEEEAEVEEALARLTEQGVTLDITALPKYKAEGETAQRIKLEQAVIDSGMDSRLLPENDPLRLYLEELAATPAAGDPQLLALRYLEGEEAAARMLCNVCLSQVVQIAAEMTGWGVLLLDLVQEGSLALWQSILSYDGSGSFESHSAWHIRQAMAAQALLQARAGETGQRMRSLLERYRTADRTLLARIGRNPTLEEIAQEMGITVEDALLVQQMVESAQTMEQVKQTSQPKEESPEDDLAVEDTAYFQSRQRILDMLSGLDALEGNILTLRFGLEGAKPLSPEETGKKLGLTAAEILTREAAALAKLRAGN